MKFLKLTTFALFLVNISALAQVKVNDKATISVPGLHCQLDKDRIERSLFKSDGVTNIKIDLKKKTVFVAWITDRTNVENIKIEIADVGYDADNVKAVEVMRLRLPAACRVVPVVVPVKPVVTETPPAKKTEEIKPTVVVPVKKPIVITPAKKPVVVIPKKN